MKLTFLRAACVLIEANGVQILTDPWLTDGEYYGAWAHYPPYDWKHDLSAIDYIYVSHIHPDHFSPATMRRLPKVPVLIHKFLSPFLRRNIEALGFEVRELPHGVTSDLGKGTKITILAADDCDPEVCGSFFGCTNAAAQSTQIDTLCVIEDGKEVLVNVNDCPYQLARRLLAKVRTQWPVIDHLLAVYAGAGPYPQCFVMTEAKKVRAARVKESQFIASISMFASDLDARMTYPFAGQYLLCGKLAELNQYRGVPEMGQVMKALEAQGLPAINAFADIDPLERLLYISTDLAKSKLDYEDDPEPNGGVMRLMIADATERMRKKQREIGLWSNTVMYVDIPGGMYRIPMNGTVACFCEQAKDEPRIRLTTDPRLLKRILSGPKHAHWNNAEIGSHITFERVPDVFERGLHQIVSFLHV